MSLVGVLLIMEQKLDPGLRSILNNTLPKNIKFYYSAPIVFLTQSELPSLSFLKDLYTNYDSLWLSGDSTYFCVHTDSNSKTFTNATQTFKCRFLNYKSTSYFLVVHNSVPLSVVFLLCNKFN